MATSPIQEIVSSVQLQATTAQLYVSTNVWTQIMKLTATNTDSNVHLVTFYIVPSGASVSATNMSTNGQQVLGADTFNSPNEYGLVLNPGDSLWGSADAAGVINVFASGLISFGS
jgi:hypothetical protein